MQDIMRGIVRKQVFVFGVPLLIGLLHSIFAIKSASFIVHVRHYIARNHRNGHLRAHLSRLRLPDGRVLSENGEGGALRIG